MLKELKELLNDIGTPKEIIGDCVGWASLFAIVFMLSIIGG